MATDKLISANSLRNVFRKRMMESFDKDYCAKEENCKTCYPGCFWVHAIEKEPAVDAVEVVHGRWIPVKNKKYGNHMGLLCSECGHKERNKGGNYCSNCGADMRGNGNG